jgi:hypothetical protein
MRCPLKDASDELDRRRARAARRIDLIVRKSRSRRFS